MSVASLLRNPFFRGREHRHTAPPAMAGISHRDAVSALEDAGFWVLREGGHVIMTNGTRILTIPCQDPIHPFTMDGIVRDAGLTAEAFRRLL